VLGILAEWGARMNTKSYDCAWDINRPG
jgi:hypothetical protein